MAHPVGRMRLLGMNVRTALALIPWLSSSWKTK